MATINRNGRQAEGLKIELTFSQSEWDQINRSGRWHFTGDDLEQRRGQEVMELIINVGLDDRVPPALTP